MIKYFLLAFLFSINVYSQDNKDEYFIKPVIKLGAMFNGLSSWIFSTNYRNDDLIQPVNPNIYLGIGIETQSFLIVDNAEFNFRFEISYGIAKTKEANMAETQAYFQNTSIPLLFWTKLKSSGRLAPYIRAGIGAEKSKFQESYNGKPEIGFSIEKWFFCYGLGAGIELNYFDDVNFAVFVDTIIKERGFLIKPNNSCCFIDLDYRNSIFNCGIEASYNF